MFNRTYFNASKNNILSKILNYNNNNAQLNYQENNDEEGKQLIEKEKINNSLADLFVNPALIVFHKI